MQNILLVFLEEYEAAIVTYFQLSLTFSKLKVSHNWSFLQGNNFVSDSELTFYPAERGSRQLLIAAVIESCKFHRLYYGLVLSPSSGINMY